MAPVAGRIADAEKYRLILLLCLSECLFAPGIPVYRIILVLNQIWGFFIF
jgi:hypothetical protein